jgi:hypothetical protein
MDPAWASGVSPSRRSRTVRATRVGRIIDWLIEIGQDLADPVSGAAVAFDLPRPAAVGDVQSEALPDLRSGPQPRRVLGRGDELRAGQIWITFMIAWSVAPRSASWVPTVWRNRWVVTVPRSVPPRPARARVAPVDGVSAGAGAESGWSRMTASTG